MAILLTTLWSPSSYPTLSAHVGNDTLTACKRQSDHPFKQVVGMKVFLSHFSIDSHEMSAQAQILPVLLQTSFFLLFVVCFASKDLRGKLRDMEVNILSQQISTNSMVPKEKSD